jgi:glycosidase
VSPSERINQHLTRLYGPENAERIQSQLLQSLARFTKSHPQIKSSTQPQFSEQDVILITYGDQLREPGKPALQTLAAFLEAHLVPEINGLHILPFYPYSSDDGFSVIDYRQVNPDLGDWQDIARLDKSFRLMFDAVINHISRQSEWFKGYQQGQRRYQDYFITLDPDTDLSMVVRPRALPLLTKVETSAGTRYVWTTFSEDQIDLNFSNPQVLLDIIDVLLFYVAHGAEIIRLDAIAYLWKEIGTSCIHLPQTHLVVKLFRAVLDDVAPHVLFITETNVPHDENLSYFGDPLPEDDYTPLRGDEAQLVYQFPLAPLILHTFITENSRVLSEWAASLSMPYPTSTFFNFIASHDGIGVRPAEGLLTLVEIQRLIDRTIAHGGEVSYKTNSDGSKSAYELNITLFDTLNDPYHPQPALDIQRFLASQAIMLSLAGVPGIYFLSLFGSRNCYTCVEETGRARSINRQKFQREDLETTLLEPDSIPAQVFEGYTRLLGVRREHPAFHPYSPQQVLHINESIFALIRRSQDDREKIICLVNVTPEPQTISIPIEEKGSDVRIVLRDLLTGRSYPDTAGKNPEITLTGYQYVWLTPHYHSPISIPH